ncbi:hypothetical protein DPQ25_11435 [Hydrogeniiclostridium mannosilyticum]|uniref:Uncharacterized protein n=1 Tax=Hydrogeniiclostridium mannosilyticum TaxID=2764322 RepID=A0A328U9E5_9FIRM|nr:hypothetical protein DPQ25_11435 [Hydrogeniiclostridium mannosilyticum]
MSKGLCVEMLNPRAGFLRICYWNLWEGINFSDKEYKKNPDIFMKILQSSGRNAIILLKL